MPITFLGRFFRPTFKPLESGRCSSHATYQDYALPKPGQDHSLLNGFHDVIPVPLNVASFQIRALLLIERIVITGPPVVIHRHRGVRCFSSLYHLRDRVHTHLAHHADAVVHFGNNW